MHPNLFTVPAFELLGRHIGPVSLPTYGVLMAAAFLVGLYVAAREARLAALDVNVVTDLALYVLLGGMVGAKLMLILVDFKVYWQNPRDLLSILRSGGVFYGGLLAALPVAFWYSRRHGLPGWKTADVLAPAVVAGQSIGRLGCFAAGCCFGKPASVPWAVTFRDLYAFRQLGTPMDTPLHPTQIYESLACFGIFLVLLWLARHKKFDGQVVLTYIVLYSVARFLIEFLRGDTVRGFLFGGRLSTSQFIAILFLLGAGLTFYRLRRVGVGAPSAA